MSYFSQNIFYTKNTFPLLKERFFCENWNY